MLERELVPTIVPTGREFQIFDPLMHERTVACSQHNAMDQVDFRILHDNFDAPRIEEHKRSEDKAIPVHKPL
jgi:hypothetical protein